MINCSEIMTSLCCFDPFTVKAIYFVWQEACKGQLSWCAPEIRERRVLSWKDMERKVITLYIDCSPKCFSFKCVFIQIVSATLMMLWVYRESFFSFKGKFLTLGEDIKYTLNRQTVAQVLLFFSFSFKQYSTKVSKPLHLFSSYSLILICFRGSDTAGTCFLSSSLLLNNTGQNIIWWHF